MVANGGRASHLDFVTRLTSRVISEHSTVRLSCVVQGPDPNIRWLKNEVPIQYSSRIKNLSGAERCVLEITDCEPDDSGIYQVLVRNQDSSITSSCVVQVYTTNECMDASPTFTRNLKRKRFISFSKASKNTI